MIALEASLLEGLDSPHGIRQALQTAVQLEHATLPPYLYALYSLKPGVNDAIGNLIRSVVFEEMTHMTLACNLLNAIGGAPIIDRPGFIPTYPGPLPGGVDAGLTVGLAPFSKGVVQSVFMEIEEPEFPNHFPVRPAATPTQTTIGMFYATLLAAIEDAGESLFATTPRNPQVTDVFARFGVIAIDGVATARQAIDTIVDQGEGTSEDPMDSIGGESEPAHYYRFAEIFHGKTLVATGAPRPPRSWSATRTRARRSPRPRRRAARPHQPHRGHAADPARRPQPAAGLPDVQLHVHEPVEVPPYDVQRRPEGHRARDRTHGIAEAAGDRADGDPARGRNERRSELRVHAGARPV